MGSPSMQLPLNFYQSQISTSSTVGPTIHGPLSSINITSPPALHTITKIALARHLNTSQFAPKSEANPPPPPL
jgi:hypothetical protein